MVLDHWDDADHGAEALSQEAFTRGSFDNITGHPNFPRLYQFWLFFQPALGFRVWALG